MFLKYKMIIVCSKTVVSGQKKIDILKSENFNTNVLDVNLLIIYNSVTTCFYVQ